MDEATTQAFQNYLDALSSAGNEEQRRQAFIVLAATVFKDNRLATNLALAAEYKVNFERTGVIRRGSADALFGNLIIEFERNLARTREHALDQLQNYAAGAWREDGNNHRSYLAVASDGESWQVFSAVPADPHGGLDATNVSLLPVTEFTFRTIAEATEFHNLLNRLFYRDLSLRPSATNIARDFGTQSPAFRATIAGLNRKAAELSSDVQYKALRDEWAKGLRIAYGSNRSSDELFALHTYLAVLARLLVWAAQEQRTPTAIDIHGVLSGDYFVSLKLQNLWEDDFFKWHSIPSAMETMHLWIALARQFEAYDMTSIDEDILKPLYEDLVDPETRHGLGEYYTPDWLADRVTARTISAWDWNDGLPRVLDPTCGSGTFLRSAIGAFRAANPKACLQEILDSVVGFDVLPLAVIVSRATYTLAIRDLVASASSLVTIPVYIADSFSLPDIVRQQNLFGSDTLALEIGKRTFDFPAEFALDADAFDKCLTVVVDVARAYGQQPSARASDIRASVESQVVSLLGGFDDDASVVIMALLVDLASYLTELVNRREDSFYGFVVRNGQRPSLLRGTFDYIIGNPPWLTIGDVQTQRYKDRLVRFVAETNVASRRTGELAHIELATLFLAHVTKVFLREKAGDEIRVGFVMTRAVFTATHHRFFREGAFAGKLAMDIREIWDLKDVDPLFRVPSCVLFAAKAPPKPQAPMSGILLSGALSSKDADAIEADSALEEVAVQFELAYLAERSAWKLVNPDVPLLPSQRRPTPSANQYLNQFRQGAILYPQTLLVVRAEPEPVNRAVPTKIRTDPRATATAKKLKDITVNHVVNGRNIYLTAAAEHIFPYVLSPDLWKVVLPTTADPDSAAFGPVDAAELRRSGRLHTAVWLEWAEEHWANTRKQTDDIALHLRLDTYGQLSGQAGRAQFLVLYNASGGRPVACSFDSSELALPFVARDKTYWCALGTKEEAAYLAAFLNSDYVFDLIRDWMTLGLFGPRDIHKRVLDVPWPGYDPENSDHTDLADLSMHLGAIAATELASLPFNDLGRQRAAVRSALPEPLLERTNELVAIIAASVPAQ